MQSRSAVTILDGGMGHLLRRHGVSIEGKIGSLRRFLGVALANTEDPRLVRQAHCEYLEAGARVITTNSYACTPAALKLAGSGDWDAVSAYIEAAGQCAAGARSDFQTGYRERGEVAPEVLIAGCVPPLQESYRHDRVGEMEDMVADYTKIVAAISPSVDVLLCETMSCAEEAAAAAVAASTVELPLWVSWTLHEDGSGNLRSQQTIADAVRAVASTPNLQCCLLNCCSHESIVSALPQLRRSLDALGLSHVRIGAYANGFETVDKGSDGGASAEYKDLTPKDYLEQCRTYIHLGATIVGGCCGVFPEHIKEVESGLGTATSLHS